ncbi:MAG: hypothetical protein V1754_11930, partial [Pseudomonadota bacterium]
MVRQGWTGLISGLGASLLVFLLELFFLPQGGSAFVALILAGVIVPIFVLFGAALGVGLPFFYNIARVLAHSKDHLKALFTGLLLALCSIPGSFWLVSRLASGRQASQIIGPLWIRLMLAMVATLIVWSVVWLTVKCWERISQRRSRLLWFCTSFGLFCLTGALFWSDVALYRRLYEYLHIVLLLTYFVTAWLGVFSFGQWVRVASERNSKNSRN